MNIKKIIKQKIANFIYSNEVIPHLSERLFEYSFRSYINNNNIIIASCAQRNSAGIFSNSEYLVNKSVGNKKVVYTCLVGSYDYLPLHIFCARDYDYICFTDNKELLSYSNYGAWKIEPLKFSELDSTRNNRWHKLHPHILFPNYDISIYIDANMQILDDFIFEQCERKNSNIVLPKHNVVSCVYDEIERVLVAHRDTEQNVLKMKEYLIKENMPHNYGLTENNLIFRKHNEPFIIELMKEWWNFIAEYSKRDQLSSSYIFWKHGIPLESIEIPNLRDEKHVHFSLHTV